MSVKNIMEDVVFSAVDRVLKEEGAFKDMSKHKNDITAYVLNRVPPKYVTSERGVLHSKLESRFFVQQKTDIFLLIHEAVDIIGSRRNTSTIDFDGIKKKEKIFSPHLIGEESSSTMSGFSWAAMASAVGPSLAVSTS